MREQNDVAGVTIARIAVGLSTSISLAPINYQTGIMIGLISGGTLEVSGVTGAWGAGRPFNGVATSEVMTIPGSPQLYLTAGGATCVAHVTYLLTRAQGS